MLNIFEYLDYRELLSAQARSWKKKHSGFTLLKLAERAGVQPPYLTNVLKGRAHLNADQLYLVTKTLGFRPEETAYAAMLLDWERSSCIERRQELFARLDSLRKQMLSTETHLKAKTIDVPVEHFVRLYLDPELLLIHAFLGVERFTRDLDLIARSLNLSSERVEQCLKELSELGFIRISEIGIEKMHRALHLPKGSPIQLASQQALRLRAWQHLQTLNDKNKYNFTVTFTADEATRERIQREFLRFLSQVEEWVKAAPSESVYQIAFDLFPWSK